MSLVEEIIASTKFTGSLLTEEYLNEMKSLLKDAEKAQMSVSDCLSAHYETMTNILCNAKTLERKVQDCTDKITELHSNIDKEILTNVEGSVGEIGRVASRLKELHEELKISKMLVGVHSCIEQANEAQSKGQFIKASECFGMAEEDLVLSVDDDGSEELDIVCGLRNAIVIGKEKLVYTLAKIWTDSVRWSKDDWSEDTTCWSLILYQVDARNSSDHLEQTISAFYIIKELVPRIKAFAKSFMKLVLKPIIVELATKTISVKADGSVELLISNTAPTTLKKSPEQIFHSIQEVLELIHKHFFHLLVDTSDGKTSLMQMLGKQIKEDLLQLILKEILIKELPTNRKDLKEYEDRVQVVAAQFHTFLVSIDFCEQEDRSLMEYATNVETVFSNKSCAKLLAKAKEIMLRPLHVTASIKSLQEKRQPLIIAEGGATIEKSTNNLMKLLSAKTFNIPNCQVSVSVCELMDVIYDTMEEACRSSAQYAGRLFCTVRNIISLYMRVVPTAHAHTIFTIPQHAALVHNNGIFLSHHCLLLCHQYRQRLPEGLNDRTITTTDLAQLLRTNSGEIFLKALRIHRDSLMETLQQGTCSTSLGCDVKAVNEAERSTKQCLNELQRLHTVWQEVLPSTVYSKSMGTLVGSVVDEVLIRIIALQDISADSALALVQLIQLLQQQIPLLFKIDNEDESSEHDVYTCVRHWSRLVELNVVLGASLRELMDRWANGSGPLALHFTPEEAKQMIRALFQNTEKRARVLSMIK